MATHQLAMNVSSPLSIVNKDIEIAVKIDNELYGTLRISRGSIDWRPRNARQSVRRTWKQFAALMEDTAKARRPPRRQARATASK